MYPPPAASRQLAELAPLSALQSAADALGMQVRQWDSLSRGRGQTAGDQPTARGGVRRRERARPGQDVAVEWDARGRRNGCAMLVLECEKRNYGPKPPIVYLDREGAVRVERKLHPRSTAGELKAYRRTRGNTPAPRQGQGGDCMVIEQKDRPSDDEYLALLTDAVWRKLGGNESPCPPEKLPTFRQIDDLISTTAWGAEARNEFFRRWIIVEKISNKSFNDVSSFAQLAHLVWQEADKTVPDLKHPLAPLIDAWHTGPMEVQAVRDTNGNLRSDTIAPRIAMRESGAKTDRLYLPPAHIGSDGQGGRVALPGFGEGNTTSRIPVLPVELYDLGVQAGVRRGGHGGAPIPARMLVKLAAAPSASVRHGARFVTYNISLRDLRDALYPPQYLDGRPRQLRPVSYMWPRVREAIRIINQDARIPILDPSTGYGHFHHLLRINENFGRIDLDMPVGVVLDIPPEVEGGVQLPDRLDQWGAESAPAYRALIGLAFLWHEPGRTHAPKGGRWIRKTALDPYDPLTDDDAITLAYPSSVKTNRRELARRAWGALESLEEHDELRIDERRILPPGAGPG